MSPVTEAPSARATAHEPAASPPYAYANDVGGAELMERSRHWHSLW